MGNGKGNRAKLSDVVLFRRFRELQLVDDFLTGPSAQICERTIVTLIVIETPVTRFLDGTYGQDRSYQSCEDGDRIVKTTMTHHIQFVPVRSPACRGSGRLK